MARPIRKFIIQTPEGKLTLRLSDLQQEALVHLWVWAEGRCSVPAVSQPMAYFQTFYSLEKKGWMKTIAWYGADSMATAHARVVNSYKPSLTTVGWHIAKRVAQLCPKLVQEKTEGYWKYRKEKEAA